MVERRFIGRRALLALLGILPASAAAVACGLISGVDDLVVNSGDGSYGGDVTFGDDGGGEPYGYGSVRPWWSKNRREARLRPRFIVEVKRGR